MCGRGSASMCDDSRGVDRSMEPTRFIDPAPAPLDAWNFVDVWLARPGDFPTLRRARF